MSLTSQFACKARGVVLSVALALGAAVPVMAQGQTAAPATTAVTFEEYIAISQYLLKKAAESADLEQFTNTVEDVYAKLGPVLADAAAKGNMYEVKAILESRLLERDPTFMADALKAAQGAGHKDVEVVLAAAMRDVATPPPISEDLAMKLALGKARLQRAADKADEDAFGHAIYEAWQNLRPIIWQAVQDDNVAEAEAIIESGLLRTDADLFREIWIAAFEQEKFDILAVMWAHSEDMCVNEEESRRRPTDISSGSMWRSALTWDVFWDKASPAVLTWFRDEGKLDINAGEGEFGRIIGAKGGADMVREALSPARGATQATKDSILLGTINTQGTELIDIALLGGADVNAFRGGPLRTAVFTGNVDKVVHLLGRGAHPDGDPGGQMDGHTFYYADNEISLKLVEAGANVNALEGGVVVRALYGQDEVLLRALMDRKADLSQRKVQEFIAELKSPRPTYGADVIAFTQRMLPAAVWDRVESAPETRMPRSPQP